MEKVTSGNEYRAKRRKIIELPSGDKFWLKKPGKTALVELMDLFDLNTSADVTELDYDTVMEEAKKKVLSTEELAHLIDVLFVHCVLRPKIVLEYTENDDEIWIEEIDPMDTAALFRELFEWIGFAPEKVKDTFFPGGQLAGKSDRVSSDEPGDKTVDDPEIS